MQEKLNEGEKEQRDVEQEIKRAKRPGRLSCDILYKTNDSVSVVLNSRFRILEQKERVDCEVLC